MKSGLRGGDQLWSSVFLLACSFVLVAPARADVFKCRSAGGGIEISNQPCAAGSKTESMQRDDVISPERQQAAERDLKRAKDFLAEREAAQAAERARQPPPTTPPAPPPPPVVEAPTTVIVIDPISRCIADVERLNLSPRRRQELLATCTPALQPRWPPTTVRSVTVTTLPKPREPAPVCSGKQCPMIGPGS